MSAAPIEYLHGPRHDLNPTMESGIWLAGTLSYYAEDL